MALIGKRVTRAFVQTVAIVCDLCKVRCTAGARPSVTIERIDGMHYGDADCREITTIDICPDCFDGKVRPAIEALGGAFRTLPGDPDGSDERERYVEILP